MTATLLDFPVPTFIPRIPWWGAHLQTLRNSLVGRAPRLLNWPAQRINLRVQDGSNDVLVGYLHRPHLATTYPLILLLHGLAGSAESIYMRETARVLLDAGFPVLRMNLRGAGESATTCQLHYYAGRSQDMRLILAALEQPLKANGVIPVGFSLGGNLLLKFMGEGGAPDILGTVAVSAPIDLAACCDRIDAPGNLLYRQYLLRHLRREVKQGKARIDWMMREGILAALTLRAFDEACTAPRNGFKSAADLYARSSAQPYIPAIKQPTLLLQARDDPWIPAAAYEALAALKLEHVRLLMPAGGGHVGFHGAGGLWYPKVLLSFAQRLSS